MKKKKNKQPKFKRIYLLSDNRYLNDKLEPVIYKEYKGWIRVKRLKKARRKIIKRRLRLGDGLNNRYRGQLVLLTIKLQTRNELVVEVN